MDSKAAWRRRVMVDSLRGLSATQLTIVHMRIKLAMGVPQIARDLHLPVAVVEQEDFLARQHVKSYLRARGVSLGDIPSEDDALDDEAQELLPGARVQ